MFSVGGDWLRHFAHSAAQASRIQVQVYQTTGMEPFRTVFTCPVAVFPGELTAGFPLVY